jgi:hypothetical protein
MLGAVGFALFSQPIQSARCIQLVNSGDNEYLAKATRNIHEDKQPIQHELQYVTESEDAEVFNYIKETAVSRMGELCPDALRPRHDAKTAPATSTK